MKLPVDVVVPSALTSNDSIYVDVHSSTEPLTNIRVTFEAPVGTTFDAAPALFGFNSDDHEAPGAECVTTGNIVACTLSELAVGAEPVRFDAGLLQTTSYALVRVTVSADGRKDLVESISVSLPEIPIYVAPQGAISVPLEIPGGLPFDVTLTAGSEPITQAHVQISAPEDEFGHRTSLYHWTQQDLGWFDADPDEDDGVRFTLSADDESDDDIAASSSRTVPIPTAYRPGEGSYVVTVELFLNGELVDSQDVSIGDLGYVIRNPDRPSLTPHSR